MFLTILFLNIDQIRTPAYINDDATTKIHISLELSGQLSKQRKANGKNISSARPIPVINPATLNTRFLVKKTKLAIRIPRR